MAIIDKHGRRLCECGCGEQLTGRQVRWVRPEHARVKAYTETELNSFCEWSKCGERLDPARVRRGAKTCDGHRYYKHLEERGDRVVVRRTTTKGAASVVNGKRQSRARSGYAPKLYPAARRVAKRFGLPLDDVVEEMAKELIPSQRERWLEANGATA